MLFKIDENLPIEIAGLFIDAEHDAKTVNDQQMQGAIDPVLIQVCKTEQCVLVTLDTDFSDIKSYPPEEFSGIIVLRVRVQAKHYLIRILRGIIPLIGREPLMQHLWIVEENRVRIRGKENE